MKKIFTLSAAIIFSVSVFSQAPAIQWQKSLGGTLGDFAYSIQQTTDGGYIVGGFSGSNDGDVTGNHGDFDYWITKLNSNGIIQWQKSLGGTSWEKALAVQQTSDGGYIMSGYSNSNDSDVTGNHGLEDYWIVKLDTGGTIQWQKSLGGTATEEAHSIHQTTDGGYIVIGPSWSSDGDVVGHHSPFYNDYWVVKLSSVGNIQWQKCLGGTGDDIGTYIIQTSDGGYIACGWAGSLDGDVTGNHGNVDYWIVKLNNSGTLQWQRSLGGTSADYATSIHQTIDGGYIVSGYTNSNDGDVAVNYGSSDCWIVKLDNTGVIQWQKSLGGSLIDKANSIQQTIDGGYVVAGSSRSIDGDVTGNHGQSDYWIVRLDNSGNIQWQKSLGGILGDEALSAQQTSDSGYIVAGFSWCNDGDVTGHHGTTSYPDFWIVKLYPDFPTSTNENNFSSSITLFPTTVSNELKIESGAMEIAALEIYDVVGVKCLTLNPSPKGEGLRIDVSSLAEGIYFVTVRDEQGNRVTKKFVKM
ncbi:MAG TPA: T9SS type A sorting domain-containing protein [Bacteroidia bacterium]|nr:T9SS type A sorting domain-containing protein [Bacteroidia bacterium]